MPDLIIDQRRRDLGGLEVGRVLPNAKRRMALTTNAVSRRWNDAAG